MRNPPRFASVPLAVLVSIVPFTFASFVGPAGADTASDCEAAFTSSPAAELTYTTDPVERLAWTGQTVHLSAGWDPSAWDSLTSAAACVRVDDTFDDALGKVEAVPANGGAFDHSFAIPAVEQGTRLCTRMRLAGDPAGEATEGVWVSKTHCYEVDHEVAEETPADDTTPPATEQPPSTTTTTAPVAAPATSEGGGSPVATPFDSAGGPGGAPVSSAPTTPEVIPLLPATGYASLRILHKGEALLFIGLGLLVLCGRPRRRRTTA
jgi:hypothetical protein